MSTHAQRPGDVPVLETRDVAVHYGGIKAVDGISLALRPGLITGIIGPNGSGKSTLVAALTRLTHLTRGELYASGERYDQVAPGRIAGLGIARTFQTVRLLPDLTVAENVMLGNDSVARESRRGLLRGRGRSRDPLVEEALERTGLGAVRDAHPTDLSYGTQRRVEIARAIAMRPRLLLLDEPTAGMNQAERAEISELMSALRDEGLSQLLIEHDVQMMLDTCDHLVAMAQGQLLTEGRPKDVVGDGRVQEAYLGKNWRGHVGAG
ncbi:ABC transporter ATP-binding protein [Nocardioides sp. LHG3406-4]|uniref:ABC transporter ATP-binding protein n=1 Tax=Nocardioides sp. LHG3406-4 TaxID=2804575 RepID=UPI003CF574B8